MDEPTEPAEVQTGQPAKHRVRESVPRIDDIQNVKGTRENKIESGNSPEKHKKKQPEAERAMEIPVDPREMAAPIDCETTSPVLRSRPPYNDAGEAKYCKAAPANAVQKAAG